MSNVSRVLSILEGTLSESTVTIEKSQGEYRVPAKDGYEDGAYYDTDKESAISVAKKTFGDDVVIKFRSVPEFVGGKYEKMRPKGKKNESLDEGKKQKCSMCTAKGNTLYYDEEKGVVRCPQCGEEYGKGARYLKKNESLDEGKELNAVAYDKGKIAGKKWNQKDKVVNPYQDSKRATLIKAWREGFEDGAYPSEARKKSPYVDESIN